MTPEDLKAMHDAELRVTVPDPVSAVTEPMNAEAVAIEWPREIWAKERTEFDVTGEHVFSVHATVARWEGGGEGEFHRYVDGDTMDSLKRYHDTMIADLRAENATLRAELDEGFRLLDNARQIERNVQSVREHEHKRAEAALAELATLRASEAAAVARVGVVTESAARVLHDIDELAANSEGVAGLHMNGKVAEWSEIMDGGAFGAWLCSAEVLRADLAEGTPS